MEKKMLVVTGVFENERFIPDDPVSIPQNKRVVLTIEDDSVETTAERVENFRKKYNHTVFFDQLKKQVAAGHSFEFDVQKVITGTETEEEKQARYRMEKQAWGKTG